MKKITALILSIIIAVTFFGCDNSSAETTVVEKTFDEKVQDLAYIANLKQYDASVAEKAYVLYSEYKSLSTSQIGSLINQPLVYDVFKRSEVLTVAEIATSLAIERIKSDLLRPSSFELVHSYVLVRRKWPKDFEYDLYPINCDIKVIIDYSAQTKAGGFDRKDEIIHFELNRFCTSIFNFPQEDIKTAFVYNKYDSSFECNSGDEYVFADGILVNINGTLI